MYILLIFVILALDLFVDLKHLNMKNLLVLDKSRDGNIILSLFLEKRLVVEKKIPFLYFDKKEDIIYLFSMIKIDWKVDLIFQSKSILEKRFLITNEKYLISLIKKSG
mgnify:CR=1 FL=1